MSDSDVYLFTRIMMQRGHENSLGTQRSNDIVYECTSHAGRTIINATTVI